jgi:hypothetical protein
MHDMKLASTARDRRNIARLTTVDGKPVPDGRLGRGERNGEPLAAAPLQARLAAPQGARPQ